MLATTARVDGNDVLSVRWDRPIRRRARLLLQSRGAECSVPVTGEDIDLSGVEIADGTWRAYLAVGGRVEPIVTTDPGFGLDGLADYARRRRRRLLHAYRAASGGLGLFARAVVPHAEVTAVHPRESRIKVEGWLAFTDPLAGERQATLTCVRNDGAAFVEVAATVALGAWRAELPVAPLARIETDAVWSLRLGSLEVAALVDDVPFKRSRIRYPGLDDGKVSVRPFYTRRNRLAILCRTAGDLNGP